MKAMSPWLQPEYNYGAANGLDVANIPVSSKPLIFNWGQLLEALPYSTIPVGCIKTKVFSATATAYLPFCSLLAIISDAFISTMHTLTDGWIIYEWNWQHCFMETT